MSPAGRTRLLPTLAVASALIACVGCSTGASSGLRAPALAFAATPSNDFGGCRLEDMPRVVAVRVSPSAGVRAEVDGDSVRLRFARQGEPLAELDVDPGSLAFVDVHAVSDSPTATLAGPVYVELEGHRHLVAWTDGSVESGLRVHALAVDANGASVGAPIELGYEGTAIGRPAVAVTQSGHGVLAFIESNDHGFELVATRVVCASASM